MVIIDAWPVHTSEEFRNWMRDTYPDIIITFVPAGCTGKAQVRYLS